MGCGMLDLVLRLLRTLFCIYACVETCSSFVWSLVLVSHTGGFVGALVCAFGCIFALLLSVICVFSPVWCSHCFVILVY